MTRLAPAVRRLLAGQAVSALGDAVLTTSAIVWLDRDITAGRPWAAAAVSGIPAAVYGAAAVAGPLAGVVVDRFDRRSVMAATELVRAGVACGLAALALLPARELPVAAWLVIVYAAVIALNGAGQFFAPARTAVIAALEPEVGGRTRAACVAEATASAAMMIGPLIAVPLTLAAGIAAALAVDAATFLVSWLSVQGLPSSRPAGRGGGVLAEFRAGLRCFSASRRLTALLSVTVTCQLGAGAVTALNVIAVTQTLHGTARDYAVAEALRGAGYIGGAVAAGALVRRAGARAVTCAGLFAAAGLTAAYALARDVPEGLVLLAGYGTAIGLLNTSAAPYLMGSVPGEYLGRAMAVFQPVNQAAGAVSVLGCGWLAGTALHGFRAAGIGPVSLLLLIGAVIIAAAGIRAAAALPSSPPPGRPGRSPGEDSMTIGPGESAATARVQEPDIVTVITFGYAWGAPPEAHAVFDVRHHFGDPDLGPELRELTGLDPQAGLAVLEAPGFHNLVDVVTRTAQAFLHLYSGPRSVVIGVGCHDGRQRSVAVAHEVSALLGYEGTSVRVVDRDVSRPSVPGDAS